MSFQFDENASNTDLINWDKTGSLKSPNVDESYCYEIDIDEYCQQSGKGMQKNAHVLLGETCEHYGCSAGSCWPWLMCSVCQLPYKIY